MRWQPAQRPSTIGLTSPNQVGAACAGPACEEEGAALRQAAVAATAAAAAASASTSASGLRRTSTR
jgi:hypothetical protein